MLIMIKDEEDGEDEEYEEMMRYLTNTHPNRMASEEVQEQGRRSVEGHTHQSSLLSARNFIGR